MFCAAGVAVMLKSGGVVDTPTPLSADVCVPTASTTESVAARFPAEVGLNAMVNVQLAPAASAAPQAFEVMANDAALAPPMLMEVIARDAVPAFARVKVCAVLVKPVATLPKLAFAGLNAACGAADDVAVPVSVAVWVVVAALSVTTRFAE